MVDTSFVSASTTIRGNISGQGSLRIEGKVRGDVSVTGDVVLGPLAQVAGNIQGAVVTVDGAVEGDITASVALSVGAAARVVGDLAAPNIGLEEGALVRGRIETDGTGAPAAGRARASASTSVTRPAATLRRSEPGRPTVVARPQQSLAATVKPEVAKPAFKLEPKPEVAKPSRVDNRVDNRPEPRAEVRREPVLSPRAATSLPLPVLSVEAEDGGNDFAEGRGARKQPPPPVVTAPRKGAKGRKKAAKRE